MQYRLRVTDTVEQQLRELVVAQADRALAVLGDVDIPRSEGIHEARRCCKRARAALRLVRTSLGRDQYALHNAAFRDAARLMSAQRDHASLLKTLAELQEAELQETLSSKAHPRELPTDSRCDQPLARAAEHLRNWIDTAPDVAQEAAQDVAPDVAPDVATVNQAEVERVVEASRRAIEQAREAARQLELDATGFDAIGPGIERSLRRGRKAYRKYKQGPTPERLHQWRKRVKDAEFQFQLLRQLKPHGMKQRQRQWSEVGSLLGSARDLGRLMAIAERAGRSDPRLSRSLSNDLIKAIDQLREQRLEKALVLGGKLHRGSPQSFRERLAASWQDKTG